MFECCCFFLHMFFFFLQWAKLPECQISELPSSQNRASDRSSSISDTSRCDGRRSKGKVSKTGPRSGLASVLSRAGISVSGPPTACKRILAAHLNAVSKVRWRRVYFCLDTEKKCVFSARVVVKPGQVTDGVLLWLAPPSTTGQTERFPARLPQTVMHDNPRWSHGRVSAGHLSAPTCLWTAAQFISC